MSASAAYACRGVRRLAIICGHSHAARDARIPPACLERLRAADAILHTGDLVDAEVLALLESLGPPVHAVHGNVDDAGCAMRLPAVRGRRGGGRADRR